MKFSNGCWLNREGIELFSPAEVSRISEKSREISLLTPCQKIRHRGDTLQGPVLDITLSSPMEGVLKIRVEHFKGVQTQGPSFQLSPDLEGLLEMKKEANALHFRSGKIRAEINPTDWNLDFYYDHEYLTGSGFRNMGYLLEDKKQSYMREQLDLSVGEKIYGLGERFLSLVRNGQSVDIWNEDGGTSTEQAYKNIPFYISNRNYGILVNHPEKVSFEVASERVSRVQFSVPGEALEYYILAGDSMKEVLNRYTTLSGKAALPPSWSFGLWLTTSFTTDYDEKTVSHFVDGMKERQIPLDVFHFDCFWMREFNWCDFTWDSRVFPDPPAMLERLKQKGLKMSVWINPYIGQASPLFEEAAEQGFLLKKNNGDIWQWDLWQPGMAIVDFTHPGARSWFQSKLIPLMEMGIDSFKTDFGERIPTDVQYHDGSDPRKMHNYYSYLYNEVVFEVLEKHKGKDQAVLFARSGTAGSQRFPIHWGGDSTSDYQSMAESLRGGLSLGLSGFSFWSHDMGGFENTSTADVYKRWAAFGLLSSHSRLHGSSSYRVPWLYDEEAVDVLRHFAQWKCRLMPYIFSTACLSVEEGLPLMRAMVLEFQDDPAVTGLELQYMLGSALLVAPVFREDKKVSWYLPQGKWTHFFSNEVKEGGRYYEESFDYMSLPLYVRPGSILALGEETGTADYHYGKDLSFHLYEPESVGEATCRVFEARNVESAVLHNSFREGTLRLEGKSAHGCRIRLKNRSSCVVEKGPEPRILGEDLEFLLPEGSLELRLILE